MAERYNPQEIEQKWQAEWAASGLYTTHVEPGKPKFYFLTMLPYPSGDLHIGHWYAMTPSDAGARYRRMRGYNAFFPIGFDAFGLPAENAAIKHGTHPYTWTMANIERMRGQLRSMGAMWAWDHEAVTCDPEFYKWTQWFFRKLYDMGLAYRKFAAVDFCPKCNTTLAREQVWGEDRHCERCGTPVIKKELEQWFFKITQYADELLNYDGVDWPERIRVMQTNWIGRSEGAEVKFETENGHEITVFTTRPDTLWGATFMVLAPEHPLVNHLTRDPYVAAVEEYQFQASRQSEIERTATDKEKTGVFTGAYAINPVNGQRIPIWIADYVLTTYGTGAIMAVPAHDERDFEFALKFGLPIVPVVARSDGLAKSAVYPGSMRPELAGKLAEAGIEFRAEPRRERGDALFITLQGHEQIERYEALAREHLLPGNWVEVVGARFDVIFPDAVMSLDSVDADAAILARCKSLDNSGRMAKFQTTMEMLNAVKFYRDVLFHHNYGTMINSGPFTGTPGDQAKGKVTAWLDRHGLGHEAVNYRLRDWLISRQRYWGAPIPMIYCPNCGTVPVPYEDLPVLLPTGAQIPPTGENALKFAEEFRHVKCPQCGSDAERETDTMDTFMCSSWYQYAYVTPYYKTGEALHADDCPWDPAEGEYWLPVDQYTGGPEHATMHLLYTRFFTKAMRDMGLVNFGEPMLRLFNQGIILGPDGNRMSKSHGNVVAPDEYVERYGADTVRAYLMFIGPWDAGGPWNFQGIEGVKRFLERAWSVVIDERGPKAPASDPVGTEAEQRALRRQTHQTIRKATEDIESFKFNTLLAALMEFNNYLMKAKETAVYGTAAWDEAIDSLILLLAPETPHVAEELWQRRHGGMGAAPSRIPGTGSEREQGSGASTGSASGASTGSASGASTGSPAVPRDLATTSPEPVEGRDGFDPAKSVHVQKWPQWDPDLAKAETITLVVQINGKVREKLEVPADIDEPTATRTAFENPTIQKWLEGKAVQKVIFAGGKLVNIVVR